MKRGDHPLPHQAQQIKRDLTGEEIAQNFGRIAKGYRRTEAQMRDPREMPYEFLLYSPRSFGTNWTAFNNTQDLLTFAKAYDLTLTVPNPGERFDIKLPDDDSNWEPLNGTIQDCMSAEAWIAKRKADVEAVKAREAAKITNANLTKPRQPMPGDAVRLTTEWSIAEAGTIGVIQGLVGRPLDELGNSVIFNPSTFRGPSSKYAQDQTECVSSSGGPGTIYTPPSELVDTGKNIEITCWRWKTIPQADGGEYYTVTVPLWDWTPGTS